MDSGKTLSIILLKLVRTRTTMFDGLDSLLLQCWSTIHDLRDSLTLRGNSPMPRGKSAGHRTSSDKEMFPLQLNDNFQQVHLNLLHSGSYKVDWSTYFMYREGKKAGGQV